MIASKDVLKNLFVSDFDINASDLTKKNLLETLSSVIKYSISN